MSQNNNGNLQWKNIIIIAVGLILLWLVFNQLSLTNAHLNQGPNLEGILFSLLRIALKVLWVFLLVGLILGLYQAFKAFNLNPFIEKFKAKEYICPSCNQRLQEEFKFCPNCKTGLKNLCTNCGKELMSDWKCCPCCGKEGDKF